MVASSLYRQIFRCCLYATAKTAPGLTARDARESELALWSWATDWFNLNLRGQGLDEDRDRPGSVRALDAPPGYHQWRCTLRSGAIEELERLRELRRNARDDNGWAPQGTVDSTHSFFCLLCSDSFFMSDKDETGEVARLERLNDDLKRSLRRCRDMLHDYEVRLTANSNELDTSAGHEKRGEA